jgi:hypothetical protein
MAFDRHDASPTTMAMAGLSQSSATCRNRPQKAGREKANQELQKIAE